MHDFAKMGYGIEAAKLDYREMYHDITGAHQILVKGQEFGLIKGGTEQERENALKRIALCLVGDWTLAEIGGESFPHGATYRVTDEFIEQVNFLRRELSPKNELLSITKLSTPNTLERYITVWADATEDGGADSVKNRLDRIINNYRKYANEANAKGRIAEAHYFKTQADISDSLEFRAKMYAIASIVDQLAGFK